MSVCFFRGERGIRVAHIGIGANDPGMERHHWQLKLDQLAPIGNVESFLFSLSQG